MAENKSHWHVATGLNGYGPESSDGGWTTMDTVAGLAMAIRAECGHVADYEDQAAEALAESGQFKAAWFARKSADALSTLADNFDYDKRREAPLYRDDNKGVKALDANMLAMVEQHFPYTYDDGRQRLYVWMCSNSECEIKE